MAPRTRRSANRKTKAPVSKPRSRPAPTFSDRLFDARPDRWDLRDLPYRPPLQSLPPRYPDDKDLQRYLRGYVKKDLVLDQGTEGACTGFGLACVVNYLLWVRIPPDKENAPFDSVSPRMLYEMAKRYDEWPGQDYEGSSCRGALKGWNKHGVCTNTLWPYALDSQGTAVFERPKAGWDTDAVRRPLGVYYRVERESIVDLQAAIFDIGAVYVSANVHEGWHKLLRPQPIKPPRDHDQFPLIVAPKAIKDLGGHSFALVGYNERGFLVQNSWGTAWGASGFGILPYDDWMEHATDAWACALGVPIELPIATGGTQALVSSQWRVAGGRSLTTIDRAARNPANPPEDPWPIDHAFDRPEYQPWPTHDAYLHTLVSGNDGQLVVSDFTRNSSDVAGYAKDIVVDQPLRWFKDQGAGVLRLAIYAHGGLNAEEESIKRIRVLAPYFQANGIYPIFLTWKTGAGETICDLAKDWARKVLGVEAERAEGLFDKLGDAKDRAVEAVGHVLGKGIWTEMRENAEMGKTASHALDLLGLNLGALAAELSGNSQKLELHLVGHSAGSILFGHLLDALREKQIAVQTFTLFAAACSSRFSVDHYLPAADAGLIDLQRLWLYHLTDENEKRDGLPTPTVPAYGKSLLYLVSRALDDKRKMPLLGMERALIPQFQDDDDQWAADELRYVQAWQGRWPGSAGNGLRKPVTAPSVRNTKLGGQIPATHGSFDNNIDLLTETLERIKGSPLLAPMEWLDY